jgi:hypothetical protein
MDEIVKSLIKCYIDECGNHCKPYILIEKNEVLPSGWDTENLSDFINSKSKSIGCIECQWNQKNSNENNDLITKFLTKSLLQEYPPFRKSSRETVHNFVRKLLSLIGEGEYFTNTTEYGPDSIGYGDLFPEHEKYILDKGLAIITGEWFVIFVHRGFD